MRQRGQGPQFGHPLLANRSAVQILFCRASHARNLTFGGPQVFQTTLHMFVRVMDRNCALYAEEAVYSPETVCFQMMESSACSSRLKPRIEVHNTRNCLSWSKENAAVELILLIHTSLCKASLTFHCFRDDASKIRGAMSLGLHPFSQGDSQKGARAPLPMVMVVHA